MKIGMAPPRAEYFAIASLIFAFDRQPEFWHKL
jgi:hypothetical protein